MRLLKFFKRKYTQAEPPVSKPQHTETGPPVNQYEYSVFVNFTDSELYDIKRLADKHNVSEVFYIQLAVYRQVMDEKLWERTVK